MEDFGILKRKSMTNYTAWFWSLGIGIPLFAIGMALLWRGAHTSIFWRLIFCFCLAIVITPVGFNNGDSQGWVFPFIFLLADSLVSRQHNEIFFSLLQVLYANNNKIEGIAKTSMVALDCSLTFTTKV